MTGGFDLSFDELPQEIAIFPLPRVILLPRVQLPLNIFEPRYLAMTRAAMAGNRLIGMIQTRPNDGDRVFTTGCAGRIVSFSETDDGRYLITLKGVCRFDIREELSPDKGGFRRAKPDWSPYMSDFTEEGQSSQCREAMMQTLRAYFDKRGMFCDKWETMKDISCDKLVSTLSVVCPFDTDEKQALLEAKNLEDRMRLMKCFIEHAITETPGECTPCRH